MNFLNNLSEAIMVRQSFCFNFKKLKSKTKKNKLKYSKALLVMIVSKTLKLFQAWLYDVIREQVFPTNSICGYSYSLISMSLIFSLTPFQSALG